MNSNTFRMPARSRRTAAVAACLALIAVPGALAAPAQATGGGGGADGRASAVVLRAGLDVSLADRAVQVPVRAALNEVTAPATASRTALDVEVAGIGGPTTVPLVRARAATARATAERGRAEGYAELARARVQVPGLPALTLVEVQKATSRAVCVPGARPAAHAELVGPVTVLGRPVTLTAGGRTKVTAEGVGEVTLDLARKAVTSRQATATALELTVAVNPLKLNIASVSGTVTLVSAACTTPAAPARTAEPGKPGIEPQGPTENLAETGGSATTGYIAGGAAVLLALGGGTVLLARSRSRSRARARARG
ncbi:SCO1860 family LAETG-anchored protein [Streptomyces yaizuensis]|uniref:LPXTG cell wall anchor domain-containing protein n=1 Tax=Streptomyces yaizuensis TaxID=2989713 RepID=A0ABQ5P7W8_9ACTN|nr:SCO1860 family LAETG-anchored protein [Streptomyces sp. YSPA8]GLF98668.1 LPXTG cell wall anchor domain-containing protein [Streptomyces sp. YSPA8]